MTARIVRAVVARAFGDPESFAIENWQVGDPGPGEVRVAVRTAAVNFVDSLVAGGRYQVRPALPFVPGGEYAGVVDAIGPSVDGVSVGDAVCGSGLNGSFGKMLVAPFDAMARMPRDMGFVDGATFRVGHATAMAGLVQGAALQPGETVLVLGAGGGVGLAAVGIARALGARVIASASSEAKRALAIAAGADIAVPADAEDWLDLVRSLAGTSGVDIVVDPIGGDATNRAFRSLGWGGRHLVIGFANGAIPSLPTNLALVKERRLIGVNIREFHRRHPDQGRANMAALAAMWQAGKIRSAPARVFPLEAFAQAMRHVVRRETVGRVVLDLR